MAIKNSIKLAMPLAAAALWLGLGSTQAKADTLYNDIPTTDTNGGHETTSFASLANNISIFGSLIHPTAGNISAATVVMSNYATMAQYGGSGDGYDVSMTLSLYNVGSSTGGSDPAQTFNVGSLVASSTITNAHIAWRPGATTSTQTCGSGNENAYTDGSGESCGQLNFVTFGFANTAVSSDLIWGLSINSTGAGPWNSLNWAISDGTDPSSYTALSNPQYGTNYLNVDGFIGTTGFGAITDWGNVGQGELALYAGTPEPATFGLIGLGLVGLGIAARRKSRGV